MAVCWVGVLGRCGNCMSGGCAACVLGEYWVGAGWVWPVQRKLELLLLEMSAETWLLQDLVSYPGRWLSKESQAGEFIEFLLAEGSKASAVCKSGGALCYVPQLLVMGDAQRPKKKKKKNAFYALEWFQSYVLTTPHHTTPTCLYSNCFTALQCF